jgi:hypothetical protein
MSSIICNRNGVIEVPWFEKAGATAPTLKGYPQRSRVASDAATTKPFSPTRVVGPNPVDAQVGYDVEAKRNELGPFGDLLRRGNQE